jgi:hypothetical protein
MKKWMIVLAVALFTSALALPVFARGPWMGGGYGMMGSWGPNSGYCGQGGTFYQGPNPGPEGQPYQPPNAQSAPDNRFGRGDLGNANPYQRGVNPNGGYGHMGGFGMGGWR